MSLDDGNLVRVGPWLTTPDLSHALLTQHSKNRGKSERRIKSWIKSRNVAAVSDRWEYLLDAQNTVTLPIGSAAVVWPGGKAPIVLPENELASIHSTSVLWWITNYSYHYSWDCLSVNVNVFYNYHAICDFREACLANRANNPAFGIGAGDWDAIRSHTQPQPQPEPQPEPQHQFQPQNERAVEIQGELRKQLKEQEEKMNFLQARLLNQDGIIEILCSVSFYD